MKNYLIVFYAFACAQLFAQAPDNPPPTSEEEYNYLTKGYKVQTESGLDMNGEVTQGSYSFQFKGLVRETKNELAGILVVTKSSISGKVYYLCIPIKNPDLMSRYYNEVNAWDEALTTAYCNVISGHLSSMTSAVFESDKKLKK
jgi:hypothetical protein